MSACAHRDCLRPAIEAHDVWSWFKPQKEQTPRHYETCAEHGRIFSGTFTVDESDRVKRELVAS